MKQKVYVVTDTYNSISITEMRVIKETPLQYQVCKIADIYGTTYYHPKTLSKKLALESIAEAKALALEKTKKRLDRAIEEVGRVEKQHAALNEIAE